MSDLYTVEVVIPIPLSQTFDYMVSKLEFENIKKGSRVIVSFGHKKLYTAIVVKKFINKQYDFNLKDIEFIVDDSPCLSTEQIDLFKWISEYYLCPIGKVYETALPKIFLVKSETIIKLSNEKNNLETSNQAKLILNDIKNSPEITLKDIIKIYGKESIKLIDELIEKNKILLSEEVFDYYKPIIKSYLKINKSVDPYNLAKTPLQKKIIDLFFLENQTEISKSRVKNKLNISDSAIKSLIRSNALIEFKKNILRSQDINSKTENKIELSKDQKTAYNRIEKEIKKEKVILFHGVTSSGKTEIYVEFIKNQLNQGNGRLQFVFLTYEYLYIVDVKGNIVKKTANKENTSKKYLSVFDYDKNKNYRLVVQEGKTVSMYDSKLSVVKGYKATRSKKTIANKMDHIRILNKDFLIQYYEDKTFTIYDRRGRERIKLPKGLKYQSTVFKHNNKLIFQGEDNEIVRIDISGEISYQPYNENLIGLVSKQDISAIHTDSKIIVNQNEFNIPYGNYTTPKIHQNYISILNLDTKELYLFSENKKIERFPIFSSNFYDFSTREKQTVLVVVGDQDELLYYTVD